ncbi:MAG: hypothetical protein ACRDOH_09980 [Streptosporangiaceae bacterium]
MATLDDVARMASELPEMTEGEPRGNRTWFVGGKAFAWDRPFSKADIRRFGDHRLAGTRQIEDEVLALLAQRIWLRQMLTRGILGLNPGVAEPQRQVVGQRSPRR